MSVFFAPVTKAMEPEKPAPAPPTQRVVPMPDGTIIIYYDNLNLSNMHYLPEVNRSPLEEYIIMGLFSGLNQ